MKKRMSVLLCVATFCSLMAGCSGEDVVENQSGTEQNTQVQTENLTGAEQDDISNVSDVYPRGEQIKEQTFDLNLEPIGEVTFASYLPDDSENPLADVVFLIEKDGEILSQLPGVSEDNVNGEMFHQVEAVNFSDDNYENDGYEYDIYISHTTECLRGEKPELYETMQKLLVDRAEMQFAISSPNVDLSSEKAIETEDGLVYYPLKDGGLNVEKIENQLQEVYEADYVDGVLLPYYFETSKLYVEQEGQLYAQDVAAVVLELQDDWKVWEVNENYYYIQGFEDSDEDVMVILTVIRSEDSSDFLISNEVEINLE